MSAHASSDTLPETADTAQPAKRLPRQNGAQQALFTVASFLVIAAMVAWAVKTYPLPVAPYGERAAFLFPLLILLVELGARRLAQRALLGANRNDGAQAQHAPGSRGLALPQITLPLYLACTVLFGVQAAVLSAFIIETVLQVLAISQRSREIREAIYRVAANGLVVLAGCGCYSILIGIEGQSVSHPTFGVRL